MAERSARIEESGVKVLEQLRSIRAPRRDQKRAGNPPCGLLRFPPDVRFVARRLRWRAKISTSQHYNFLVRYYARLKIRKRSTWSAHAREMAKGGMNDQLGGGFHRYSVDERWFVPHFEKMLYDQAQLAVAYLEAFQITRDGQYAMVARDILEYVLRDLTDPDGGFYSAEDADSAADPARPKDKSEGAFYLWSRHELEDALGSKSAGIFSYCYGVEPSGNVEEDPHGEFRGRNILFQAHTIDETAAEFGISAAEIRASLSQSSAKLLEIRSSRPRPQRDDKILSSWNGMMISAFAKAAQILDEPRYLEAAGRAARFIQDRLWDEKRGTLLRRYCGGEAAVDGFLDDYAYAGLAMLDLYETSFVAADLGWAIRLAERALAFFGDRDRGGFFSTTASSGVASGSAAGLVLRLKDDYDGAEPSGSSGMAMLLARLARMTDRADFRDEAEQTLRAFDSRLRTAGTGLPQMLVALSFWLAKPVEIVFAGPGVSFPANDLLGAVRRRFLPNAVLLHNGTGDVTRVRTGAKNVRPPMPPIDGRPTAYVCENYACQLPVTDAGALDGLLDPLTR